MADADEPEDSEPVPRDHGLNGDEELDAVTPVDVVGEQLQQRIVARKTFVPGDGAQLTWERFQNICSILSETGTKYRACELGGFRYATVFNAIKVRNAAGDEVWQELWDLSMEHFRDGLVAEARSRAVDGWKEPVFHKGELTGYIRRKSDRLLELLLRGHIPETYRENVHVTGAVDLTGGGLDILKDLSLDAKKRIRDIIIEDLKSQAGLGNMPVIEGKATEVPEA